MDQLILVWVVFGAAAAAMAKSKGRNIYFWVFVGLLIGPFAVLIISVMKRTATGDKEYD
jgi:ABC-type glycerol-3-phosphate transport system permease component